MVGLPKEGIPPFLATIIWIGVDGPDGIPAAAEKAARAIFRVSDKPLVSPRPAYLSYAGPGISGLSPWDVLVLKAAGEEILGQGIRHLSSEVVFARVSESGMPMAAFRESIDILDEKHHLSRQGVLGDPYKYMEVTVAGFELFCERFFPDYATHAKKITIAIIDGDHRDPDRGWHPAEAKDLAQRMELPETVAIQVFQNLERLGRIRMGKTLGVYEAISVSPALKREMLASKE